MLALALFACSPAAGPGRRVGDPVVDPPVATWNTTQPPPVTTETAGTWTGTVPTGGDDTSPPVDTAPPPIVPGFGFTDVTAQAGVAELQWAKIAGQDRDCDWGLLLGGDAAAEDYDGDGDIDLFVPRFIEPSRLYQNNGDGTFVDVAAAAGIVTTGMANGAGFADLDGDGDLDLLVTRLGHDETNYLYINDGTGHFTEEAAARGLALPVDPVGECSRQYSVAFADYDHDGDLDVHLDQWNNILPTQEPSRTMLLRNDGGSFVDVTVDAGVHIHGLPAFTSGFTDFDGDGWEDLWIVADFSRSTLFRNLGDGTFADVSAAWGLPIDTNGMGGATGDWDGDGDPDWFVTAILPDNLYDCARPDWGCSGNVLYLDGGGAFTNGTPDAKIGDGGWGWGALMSDVDLDGDLDVFHASGEIDGSGWPYGPEQPVLFVNDGGVGTNLATELGLSQVGLGRGVLAFDADNDGDDDLFQVENAGYPVLWRNDLPATSWLRIRLQGTVSNGQGIGARVEVQAVDGGPVQVRWMNANSTFSSMGPVLAAFGFGAGVPSVHRVTITWPVTGARQELIDVSTDQTLLISEP